MAINLGQLRQITRTDEIKIDRNGRLWNDTTLNDAINSAILDVSADFNFRWQEELKDTTFSSVIDQNNYPLPSQFVTFDVVRFAGKPMISTTLEQIKQLPQEASVGDVRYYYVRNGELFLYPTPKSVQDIEVLYRIYEPTLVNDTDEIVFPDYFKKLITIKASYICFSQYGDDLNIKRAQTKAQRYREERKKIVLTHALPDTGQIQYQTSYKSRASRQFKRYIRY